MKRVKLFGFFLFIHIQLFGQNIINYTTANGLLDNFVECIDVDANDNVWLGTSMGVQMYDGINWYVWDQANFPTILSDNIKCIKATSNGEIWIGTDYGVNRLLYNVPGNGWISYTSLDGLINNQVKSIDEDANGDVWIGTSQGVSFFDGNTWISYSSPDIHWSGVNATAFDSNGDKWFASPLGGITHFDGDDFTVYDTSNGLLSQNVTDLIIDSQDNKWVGTGGGISILDPTNTVFTHHTQMYILSPPDTLNPVVDIEIDSDGRAWVAIYVGYLAQGGVAMLSGNQWSDFDVSDGLIGQNVRGISIDSEDNIWIATSTGVSKILAVPSLVSENSILGLKVFPNPANSELRIISEIGDVHAVHIYNSSGALIYVDSDFNHFDGINISTFSSGLYHIFVDYNEFTVKRNLVIVK